MCLRWVSLSAWLLHPPRNVRFRHVKLPLLTLMVCGPDLFAQFSNTGSPNTLTLLAFAVTLAGGLVTLRTMTPLNLYLSGHDALKPPPAGEEDRPRWAHWRSCRCCGAEGSGRDVAVQKSDPILRQRLP